MDAAVDLYWIPLGAGAPIPVVRASGWLYETWAARRARRDRCRLYHAALVVRLGETSYAVEMGPQWGVPATERGVVAGGPVGLRALGRWRWFRYEVRRWPDGRIPDLAWNVGGPVRVSADPVVATRVLAVLAIAPTPVWGRDELGAGEMWNSNSLVAWALATGGAPTDLLAPPPGGRAPGWSAGLTVAARSATAGPAARHARVEK